MRDLVEKAQQSCLLQLELLRSSVQAQTDVIQHHLQDHGTQTQAVVREESQRILDGQAHILRVLMVPEDERQQLAAEASRHLKQARTDKAAQSELFLLDQV